MRRDPILIGGLLVILAFAAILVSAKDLNALPLTPTLQVEGGRPQVGRAAFQTYGCGSCHVIPGVAGANGKVGPPLTSFSARAYIAGEVANTPDNLVAWIVQPQNIEPNTAMPMLGVSIQAAKDMAAYLYTLR